MKESLQPHTAVCRNAIADVDIIGVRVHRITSAELQSIVLENIRSGERGMYLYVHLHSLNLAYTDENLRDIFNSSSVTFCDGEGVRIGARILGSRLPERIPLTRWIYPFLDFCGHNGLSVYFLGSEHRIISRAVDLLRHRFPSLVIKGFHDGYFHAEENGTAEVIAEIRRAQPDVLIVGMGTPLQEKWIRKYWAELQAGAVFTAGSCFDYVAGEKPPCPHWMAEYGFEWLHRLYHEPRRVWKRYLIGIPLFLFRIVHQRLAQ